MKRTRLRRIFILLIAVILFAVPIITPLLELSGSHNHTCSAARCLLCTVSGTLSTITDLFAVLICTLLPFIILIIHSSSVELRSAARTDTPIVLKTKILS